MKSLICWFCYSTTNPFSIYFCFGVGNIHYIKICVTLCSQTLSIFFRLFIFKLLVGMHLAKGVIIIIIFYLTACSTTSTPVLLKILLGEVSIGFHLLQHVWFSRIANQILVNMFLSLLFVLSFYPPFFLFEFSLIQALRI